MAPRTKVVLVLVVINIVVVFSESEKNYAMDKDSLLRGSGEERDRVLDEVMKQNVEDIAREDNEKVEELKSTTDTTNTQTTIETEEIPEALGLQTTINKTDEESSDYEDQNQHTDEESISVTPTDVTETATETLSAIDNNVYISNASDNNIDGDTKTETSSSATTRAMDEMEGPGPNVMGLAEEHETPGPRNPKTENSDRIAVDRIFEPRPLAPAASKSATLKAWLEDSWLRPPAGILVPLRPMALNRALAVWNDLTVDGLNVTDIVIVGYDSNGVNWRSRHNLQPSSTTHRGRTVSEALSKLLLKYQGVNTDAASDGTMRALASATKLVPYDSALFVVTDKGPGDGQRLPLALRALVEKRLKVYTIWTNPNHPSAESEHELQDLKNISEHTEGEVLPYSLQVMDMDGSSNLSSDPLWEPLEGQQSRQGRVMSLLDEEKLDILLVRRGGGEALSLGVPVENGVAALRIFIEGLVEHAVLYPPNDAPQIDLYNTSSVQAFSPLSRTDKMSPRDVYLVFPGANMDTDALAVLPMAPTQSPEASAPTAGLWHLSVRCDTCDYRLCVTARTTLHLHATVEPKDMLKLRVLGPVSSVRESVLVDEYGTELAKLPFSYQPIAGDGQEPTDSPAELVVDVPLPSVKGSRVYAKIVGRDVRGEPFVRLAGPINSQEIRMGRSASIPQDSSNDLERAEELDSRAYQRLRYNDSNVLPYNRAISQVVNQRGSLLTSVQIGLSTRLYGAPGDSLQLHFEVTNFREQTVRFQFEAVGELRFLRAITPTSQNVPSGQTVNVIVSLLITATAQPGARDLITFTAYGIEQVSMSAYVYVVNSGDTTTDVWAPELRHNFQGTCLGRLGSDCAQHTWSATIIARDNLGGLLRLASSPIGLQYDSNFISGTREEVVAIYRATCCAPRVMVTAVDAYGNANSYIIDISNYFTEAAIAAIVLGVFLLIAIIALIVFLVYWCVRRRRESRELPSYATSSRNVS